MEGPDRCFGLAVLDNMDVEKRRVVGEAGMVSKGIPDVPFLG